MYPMTTPVAGFLLRGQTSRCTPQPCASQVPFTFQTHHAKHAKAANSNQMEHLEIIKVKDS